jgi:hypothetical protein
MTLRTDSYSSTAQVKTWTRHLLDGQTAFNSTTRPTATELENFIDRASAMLNIALAGHGFSTPVTNSTAKLGCDDWVTAQSSMYVELTQRGTGFSNAEGARTGFFKGLMGEAEKWVLTNELGLKRIGVSVAHGRAEGLQFTGQAAVSERADVDDDALTQPTFTRAQWDNE